MVRGGLKKRITEMAEANRSMAYQWLKANRVEIAKAIPVRGSWRAIRTMAIEAGVKVDGKDGKSDPTVQALRSAWRRVEADVGKPKPTPRLKRTEKTTRPRQTMANPSSGIKRAVRVAEVSQPRPGKPKPGLEDEDFQFPDAKPTT